MPFAVILVEPEQPENIGFVARSMQCFQVKALHIVTQKPLGEAAFKTGVAAKDILENVLYHSDLKSALNNVSSPFQEAWGFTRRPKTPEQSCLDWWKFLDSDIKSSDESNHTALVFGRESQGLYKEETLLLTSLFRIDLPESTMSLNLSHAVTLVLADLHRKQKLKTEENSISKGEYNLALRDKTLMQWVELLRQRNFFHPEKEAATLEYLHLLWQRVNPQEREIDFLNGLLRKSIF